MSKTIAFFPHNLPHLDFFLKVGQFMEAEYGVRPLYIRELGDVPGRTVLEFESEMERLWGSIDVSYPALQKLEKEYSDSKLMRALYCERRFNFLPKYYRQKPISYTHQLKYMVACFKIFDDWLAREKVDYVVSELLIGLPDSILYEVCKKKGVQFISIRPSKLSPGVIKCQPEHEAPMGMMDVYKQFSQTGIPSEEHKAATTHIEEIRSRIVAPPYMESSKKDFRFIDFNRLPSLLSKFGKKRMKTNSVSRIKNPIRESIRWHTYRLYNVWWTKMNTGRWFCREIPEGEKYFVFPLQYEPESSTLVRAFPFSDQMGVVQHIAKLLPLGTTLLVKEHRGNHGYRKPANYRDLNYLPNVRLIPREADVLPLIQKSTGVITLSSRMGWEALVLKKPVIALGTTFWSDFDYVQKPESWDEFNRMLKACVLNSESSLAEDYETRLAAYAAAYISLTREGRFLARNETFYSRENVKKITDAILEK